MECRSLRGAHDGGEQDQRPDDHVASVEAIVEGIALCHRLLLSSTLGVRELIVPPQGLATKLVIAFLDPFYGCQQHGQLLTGRWWRGDCLALVNSDQASRRSEDFARAFGEDSDQPDLRVGCWA